MMRALRWLIAATIAFVTCTETACAPAALPPSPTSADPCEASCARRAAAGCLEPALASTCVPTCRRATAARMFDPACVLRATTRDELARCRVRCER